MKITLGNLEPARFNVPQNVFGMGDLVAARFNVPQNTLHGPFASGMGSLDPARFSVPQNTFSGLGCACQDKGMGDLDFSSVGSAFDSDVFGVPVTWLIGGLAVAYFVFGDRGTEYRYKKSQLKKKYPTRGGAVSETAAGLLG